MSKTKNGMFELLDAGNTLRNELEDNNTNWQVVEDELEDKLSTQNDKPLIAVHNDGVDCNQILDFWSAGRGPNHPNDYYFWYVNTIMYRKADLNSNRLQMAYGYNSNSIYYRRFYNGFWTEWVRVL